MSELTGPRLAISDRSRIYKLQRPSSMKMSHAEPGAGRLYDPRRYVINAPTDRCALAS
jgi:hypothetical protein